MLQILTYKIALLRMSFITLILITSGCSLTDSNGVKHTLILGVGYVSQAKASGISVSDVTGLGLTYDEGINLGLVKRNHVEIDPKQAPNAIISINTTPFSLTVKNSNPYENPKK